MCRRRKDGSEFLARVVVSRRDDADGQPTGFLVVTRDVTSEQRRLEQERLLAGIGLLLTSSLDREQIASSVGDLLVRDFADACILDLAEGPEQNGVTPSGKVVLRDGRKRELAAALEKIPFDRQLTIVGASRQSHRTTLVSHVTAEHLDRIARSPEHRWLLQELAPVSMISVPLQARGLLLGVLTFVSSRRSRRYDESDVAFVDALGQRVALAIDNARLFETATRAVAARDDVLRVVAHDLRNPLGNILMQASLLRSMKPDADSKTPKLAEGIERAARRMNRLIKDLLDVSRLESGHLAVEPARISARQLVGDAVEGQRALASRASIDLDCAIPRDLPDVLADRDRMLQVFENLIGNAIKFTQSGGRVTVGASARDGHVTFSVSDTGAGISASDLPHVFDRFWQVQKSEGGGAGLGLTIVKGLVEAQGGHIRAQSTPGKGTTFSFTVPVAPPVVGPRAQNIRRAAGT
jgi:signal transduction histidine kinase